MSRDPIAEGPGLHLYSLCENSPAYHFDGLGLLTCNLLSVQYAKPGAADWVFSYLFKTQFEAPTSEGIPLDPIPGVTQGYQRYVLVKVEMSIYWVEKADCRPQTDHYMFYEWFRLHGWESDKELGDPGSPMTSMIDHHGMPRHPEMCSGVVVTTYTYGYTVSIDKTNNPEAKGWGTANKAMWTNGGTSDKFYNEAHPPQPPLDLEILSATFWGNTKTYRSYYNFKKPNCCCKGGIDQDLLIFQGEGLQKVKE